MQAGSLLIGLVAFEEKGVPEWPGRPFFLHPAVTRRWTRSEFSQTEERSI